MIKIARILLAAMMFLAISSCKTKQVENTEEQRVSTKSEVFRTLSIDKMSFSLTLAGTEMNSSGSIRIARDSVIICSVMPLPGMEFFRIAINKTGVVMINRVDKKFVSVSYEEMRKKGMELNYSAFEAIFTNRLFLYGEDYFPKASDFGVTEMNGRMKLMRTKGNVLQEFEYNSSKELASGSISIGSDYFTEWRYQDYFNVKNVRYPRTTFLSIKKGSQRRDITMTVEDISLDKDRNFEVKIPSTYQKISMEDFLKSY
ncbi:MAG: DUF4292 domain-containing protein [Paludibacteraceae bacterium]|nr:DUF4292 domain-containing protein [Paludibacteraceae bacterium]